VLQSLGIPPLNLTVEEREEPTYRYAFRRLLQEFVREHQGVCLNQSSMVDFWSCLEFLINNNYIPFIKPYKAAEGVETFRITTEVEQHVGVSTKVLCPDLGGELLSRRKTRNSDYLNNCIIDKDTLAEAIGAATLSTGNASSGSSGEGNGDAGG